MNKVISVIVPVYKVEEYLDRCIQSVLNQHYSYWEVILVDDGSPDRSPQICDKYAKQYSNISVIHKNNSGPSDSRNAGLKQIKGDLLLFLDSDDWLSGNDAFDRIIKHFPTNADMMFMDYTEHYATKSKTTPKTIFNKAIIDFSCDQKYNKDILERAINEIYSESRTHAKIGFPWSAVYNVNFIKRHNLLFAEGTCFVEDKAFVLRCISCADNLYYHSFSIYNYYIREGTLSHTSYDGRTEFVLDVLEKIRIYVSISHCKDASFHKRLLSHFEYVLITNLLWRSSGSKDIVLKKRSRLYCSQLTQSIHESNVMDFPLLARTILWLIRNNHFWLLERLILCKRTIYDLSKIK